MFGYPISEEFREVNPDDGREYTVQYFERQRFEWHPGAWPERYDVLLGRLGAQLLAQRLAPPQPTPTPTPTPTPAPEATISLSPESDVNLVGTEHTVTARVERGGEPVEDVRVRFRVTGAGEPTPASGSDRTDENGQATFAFTNSEVGTNTITAFADLDDDGTRDDGEAEATASKRWESEAEIALSPESDVNLGETEHTVIAEVTVDGTPQDGLPVTFAVTSEGSPDPEGDTVVTNADGEASFTYTNTVAGTDTITACLDLDEDGCEAGEPSATASKRWVVDPTLDLQPELASNPAGESHTVTATLADDACPVEGVRIVFRVTRQVGGGSPSPSSGAAFTDENGQASFTYSSGTMAAATDMITAFADFDRDNVRDVPGELQATATKSWTP